jgi:NAD(P)-dependent dehydrogenase (short-subunit alcohol dehydrogenase family)
MPSPLDILVTGGTGYIGRNLIPSLLARGHRVRVLAREESVKHVPAGATAVTGDALSDDSVAGALRPGDTLIHLVGTPHPTPSKVDQFEKVDLVSIRASVSAARRVKLAHLVYVSVAQPAPIMQAYLWVRALGKSMIRPKGSNLELVNIGADLFNPISELLLLGHLGLYRTTTPAHGRITADSEILRDLG